MAGTIPSLSRRYHGQVESNQTGEQGAQLFKHSIILFKNKMLQKLKRKADSGIGGF
jgi:hypothetical protein